MQRRRSQRRDTRLGALCLSLKKKTSYPPMLQMPYLLPASRRLSAYYCFIAGISCSRGSLLALLVVVRDRRVEALLIFCRCANVIPDRHDYSIDKIRPTEISGYFARNA